MNRQNQVVALLTGHPPQPKEGGPHGEGSLSGGGARQTMSTKAHKSSASSTLAIVVSSESAPTPKSSDAELKKQFDALCKDAKGIQRETEKLVGIVRRNILKLAQTLHRAKLVYEQWTGTGHGKRRKIEGLLSFDEEISKRTGVSRGLVQKYCQIGKLAPETASLIEGRKLAGNLTALVRIAQAEGLASIAELTEAVNAFEDGGRKAMDVVLDKAAPKEETRGNSISAEVEPTTSEEAMTAFGAEALNANIEATDAENDAPAPADADEDGRDEPEAEDDSEINDAEDATDIAGAAATVKTGASPRSVTVLATTSSTVPSEPVTEVVEVPMGGQGGKCMLFGADVRVELVRTTGRQCGLVVRITATLPSTLGAARESANANANDSRERASTVG